MRRRTHGMVYCPVPSGVWVTVETLVLRSLWLGLSGPIGQWGPDNPSHRDLSTGVSTVTHTPEGTGQYFVPGVRLRMIKGDTKRMTKDEVVLKTSLKPRQC